MPADWVLTLNLSTAGRAVIGLHGTTPLPAGLRTLARLIAAELPLDEWIRLVRAEQPEPARFRGRMGSWWRRLVARLRRR